MPERFLDPIDRMHKLLPGTREALFGHIRRGKIQQLRSVLRSGFRITEKEEVEGCIRELRQMLLDQSGRP